MVNRTQIARNATRNRGEIVTRTRCDGGAIADVSSQVGNVVTAQDDTVTIAIARTNHLAFSCCPNLMREIVIEVVVAINEDMRMRVSPDMIKHCKHSLRERIGCP